MADKTSEQSADRKLEAELRGDTPPIDVSKDKKIEKKKKHAKAEDELRGTNNQPAGSSSSSGPTRKPVASSCSSARQDLAIDMLKSNPGLAKVRNKYDETGLTVLARTPLTFVGLKLPHLGKSRQYSQALDLVKMLCDYCLNNSDEENQSSTAEVANLLFDAAEAGNVDILIKLMHFNPDLRGR
ncbi:hypothetical protein FEM48_Zijuj03G0131600 [Ziziphus jujuba var. spinosa]|uniref:Uncharacterized protein n=1 Tax=Ziziphus jujuba var. spinosa TaxID=714518 RepID=A0A978VQH5_ZIZJJ|nr:hypothetical protein FEM48_Zijuj03G0131600 [Ziziphus jujuba var. spinosa]